MVTSASISCQDMPVAQSYLKHAHFMSILKHWQLTRNTHAPATPFNRTKDNVAECCGAKIVHMHIRCTLQL